MHCGVGTNKASALVDMPLITTKGNTLLLVSHQQEVAGVHNKPACIWIGAGDRLRKFVGGTPTNGYGAKNIGEEHRKVVPLCALHQYEFGRYSFLSVSAGLISAALIAWNAAVP